MQEEIEKRVADEMGIPLEQVKIVVSDFWKGLRDKLTNIDKIGLGINIEKFLTIGVKIKRVERDLEIRNLDDKTKEQLTKFKENYYGKKRR